VVQAWSKRRRDCILSVIESQCKQTEETWWSNALKQPNPSARKSHPYHADRSTDTKRKRVLSLFERIIMLPRLANIIQRRTFTANRLSSLTRTDHGPTWFRANSTSNKRPLSELYYHLVKAPSDLQHWSKSVFAVSYLPEPPLTLEGSKTVLGVIPALEAAQGLEEPGLNDFKENCEYLYQLVFRADFTNESRYSFVCISLHSGYEASFLDLMHDVVHTALVEGADEGIQAEATQRGFGWLHIQGDSHLIYSLAVLN
jgi:hypothetical protein